MPLFAPDSPWLTDQEEIRTQKRQVEAEVAALGPEALESELERLRAVLLQTWPEVAPLLAKVEGGERIFVAEWVELGLDREAYLVLVRFRAVWRRLRQTRSG